MTPPSAPSVSVRLSGILLSLLQFEATNDPLCSDVEGLLFGEMRNVYGVNISDNQDDQATSSLHINITSYAIIHPENRLYNSAGVIDITRLQTLLKASNNNLMSVTGLFKFRRNVLISPSVRDEAVYESLQQIRLASGIDASVVDHQLLGLFTATMDDAATMTQEFGFMHRPAALIVHGDTNRVGHPSVQFTRLPSKISNMHDQGSTGIYNSSQLPFFGTTLFGLPQGSSMNRLMLSAQRQQKESMDVFDDAIVDLKKAIIKFVNRENDARSLRLQAPTNLC